MITLKAIGELQRMRLRYALAATARGDDKAAIDAECADFDSACRDIASALDERERTSKPTFQMRVLPWMLETFGAHVSADIRERGDRLLEEVLELLQSHGYDPSRVDTLRAYTYGRPPGQPRQEVGGVMLTLAAYCLASGIDMHNAGDAELARVWTMVDVIRRKQASKRDLHSPIPGLAAECSA